MIGIDPEILNRSPIIDLQSLDGTDCLRTTRLGIAKAAQPGRFGDKAGAGGDLAHQAEAAIATPEAGKDIGVEFTAKALVLGGGVFAKELAGVRQEFVAWR